MSFSSINIQGNIVSSEILDKIRSEEKFKHQTPEAFGLARSASLRDEIGMAWSIMRTHWQAYKRRLENLPQGDTGTSLTREKLIVPLLTELGYVMGLQRAQLINGKSYNISHGATNIDNYPIHIMGYNDNLDKRRDTGGQKVSPHALVQEYLNNTEHLYALVTNGRYLRLLRDATRLVRMSYLEFDLERMFEEELYADFSILFRVLHATRMPQKMEAGADSVIEYYHQESMASGTRIRTKLSEAVEVSIKTLANGFLANSKNTNLVALLDNDKLKATSYYTHQLRLIYRILFLIVLEERKLIFPEELTADQQRFREIYFKYYSIERLRKLTENKVYIDADKYDLWESLKTTFLLFESQEYGNKIGIKPLGSGLFASNALGTLTEQFLSNGNLIEVLKRLTTFVNEQNQLVRVNYSDLDVEEFGSVYEGLLEYDPVLTKIEHQYHFSFVTGDGRSSSGSHYTPEELVKPLIKHSLDYIIADKLKEPNPEEGLLSITVCDVACGSGHILLSAARKIAAELASIREGAEQPSPAFYRSAIRDVIKNCIYGVDLNPLAVELCKVALWLEAHEPGQPMNFLDHHIKCGNAIVGLAHFEELENGIASEAFKTLPGDEKELAAAFKKRNSLERKTKGQLTTYDTEKVDNDLKDLQKDFVAFTQLLENTPEQIAKKEAAYKDLTNGKKWFRLKQLADIQVAQFFIPKTTENKLKLTSHSEYMSYLKTAAQIKDQGASMSIGAQKRFFHWFLEFPQVFQNGGFNCILGNPPFLGDRRLKEAYGEQFLEWIRTKYTDGATVDLVVYFFLRINNLISSKGFQSLISTNTVAQGKAREFGLEKIIANGSTLNFAVKGMKWPGLAAVEVSLITIYKSEWKGKFYLNGSETKQISPFLDTADNTGTPFPLFANEGKSFQGSIVLGKGFILEPEEANRIIKEEAKNKEVLFPYLNGDDLNNNPEQNPSRFVINFFDWSEKKIEQYQKPFNILFEKVKPERQRWKEDKLGNPIIGEYALRKPLPAKWWQHAEKRPALYKAIKSVNRVLISCRVSKYVNQSFVAPGAIFDVATSVVTRSECWEYAFLQSSAHNFWAWKYGSTMKFDIRYTNRDCIDTFPILENLKPEQINELENIGKEYHEFRKKFLFDVQLGLTKTYNLFHSKAIQISNFNDKDKQTISLQKHLNKTENTISFNNAVSGILKLRDLHIQLDKIVLDAYGWNDILLRHDFYELDNLPENDRVRYTIHPVARKEILKRLLELNHKIHEEEVAAGLWEKKKAVKKEKVVKGKKAKLQKEQTNQVSIFDTSNDTIMKEFKNTDGIYTITDVARIINKPTERVRRWFNKLAEIDYEGLDGSIKTDIDKRQISFLGLVELVIIGELIENDFNIRAIFKARQDLADKTGKTFPFATNNVNQKLKVSGSDITWDFEDGNVTLNGKNQFNLEIIREFFKDIEFDTSGIAQRITPAKGLKLIEITPTVGGGKPSIISQKGVNVETILRFYTGPDSIDEIIEDYSISKEDIEAVLAYQS